MRQKRLACIQYLCSYKILLVHKTTRLGDPGLVKIYYKYVDLCDR